MPDRTGPDSQHRSPTIRDVAERAHVSKSLVSLVLGESPKVSSKSRAAVLEAIDELGYRPNAVARSLVKGRSNVIGIVISDAHNAFHATVMEGVQISASQAGLSPLIMHGQRQAEQEAAVLETFLGLRVDALILVGSVLPIDQLESLGRQLPVAVIGRRVRSDAVDVVVSDSRSGAGMATEHLINLGHRNIAHIDATMSKPEPECLAGYLATMQTHSLQPNVVPGSFLQEGGESGARQLLEQDELPTAVYAATDLAALGARQVFQEAGLSIPDQISLVGYDDTPFASLYGIELTTVREPARAMGIYAAEVIVNRILDPSGPTSEWITQPELVVRNSTGPPSA